MPVPYLLSYANLCWIVLPVAFDLVAYRSGFGWYVYSSSCNFSYLTFLIVPVVNLDVTASTSTRPGSVAAGSGGLPWPPSSQLRPSRPPSVRSEPARSL